MRFRLRNLGFGLAAMMTACCLPTIAAADALQDWHIGVEASKQQAHARAAYYFSRAIDLGWLAPSDRAKVYYNRGRAYTALGDYHWAIEDYTHAIELNPEFSEAFHGRAVVFDLTGERLRAIKDLQRAHALAPNNHDIRQTLSKLGLIPGDKFAAFAADKSDQPTTGRRYMLHLASLRARGSIAAGWRQLRRDHAGLIGDFELVVQNVELEGKGKFHRILASGNLDRPTARGVCGQLKKNGQYCSVMVIPSE